MEDGDERKERRKGGTEEGEAMTDFIKEATKVVKREYQREV